MRMLRIPRPVRAILGGAVLGGALAFGGAVTVGGAAAYAGVALVLKGGRQVRRRSERRLQQLQLWLNANLFLELFATRLCSNYSHCCLQKQTKRADQQHSENEIELLHLAKHEALEEASAQTAAVQHAAAQEQHAEQAGKSETGRDPNSHMDANCDCTIPAHYPAQDQVVSLQTEADETKAAAPLEDEALPVLNNCGAEMGEESGRPEAVLLKDQIVPSQSKAVESEGALPLEDEPLPVVTTGSAKTGWESVRPKAALQEADAVPARQTGGFVPETTNPFVTTTNPSEASNPWETKKPLKMLGWAKNEAERSQVPVNETLYQSDVSGTRAMVADLKAQLEALAWQNNQMQEQLASKDTELLSRGQQVQGLNQLAMWWEGQASYEYWSKHGWVKPEGQQPATWPLKVAKLASSGADLQIRRKHAQLTGLENITHFHMKPAAFSSSVRMLAVTPDQPADLGILGTGASGAVMYGEMCMRDDKVEPCALKRVLYHTSNHQHRINAELAALRDIVNMPGVVQCLAVFDEWDESDQQWLWIALRLAEGVELRDAMLELKKLQHEPGYADKFYGACKLLLLQLFETLSQLHAKGRAHGDLKYANLRVQMGKEPGVFGHLETLDFGSSTRYRGTLGGKPANLTATPAFYSPEYARQDPDEFLDACSQDMWAAGVLAVFLFGGFVPFIPSKLPGGALDWQRLCSQHETWAASYEVPDAIATCAHPILADLRKQIPDEARYREVAGLVRQLCHPAATARGTPVDALQASLFGSAASPSSWLA
ncbi:hypothetical protein ABBQ38_011430 [Trebouxia sp. C0009 RCD-2024]